MGNKLKNLITLYDLGVRVPKFTYNHPLKEKWENINMVMDFFANFDGITHISVRSSGTHSMPGILKTVLNVPLHYLSIEKAYDEVLASYNSPLAKLYRSRFNLPEEENPVVIFQQMISGDVGVGVFHTYEVKTGDNKSEYSFTAKANSNDVVVNGTSKLHDTLPTSEYLTLQTLGDKLTKYFKYPQEIEFVIEWGKGFGFNKVWILQTRNMVFQHDLLPKVAYNLWEGNIITNEEAKQLIPGNKEDYCKKALNVDKLIKKDIILKNNIISFSEGVGSGTLGDINYFNEYSKFDYNLILFVEEINFGVSMELVSKNCKGIITTVGNEMCHASILSRKFNIPCLFLSNKEDVDNLKQKYLNKLPQITIDGYNRLIVEGLHKSIPHYDAYYEEILDYEERNS